MIALTYVLLFYSKELDNLVLGRKLCREMNKISQTNPPWTPSLPLDQILCASLPDPLLSDPLSSKHLVPQARVAREAAGHLLYWLVTSTCQPGSLLGWVWSLLSILSQDICRL